MWTTPPSAVSLVQRKWEYETPCQLGVAVKRSSPAQGHGDEGLEGCVAVEGVAECMSGLANSTEHAIPPVASDAMDGSTSNSNMIPPKIKNETGLSNEDGTSWDMGWEELQACLRDTQNIKEELPLASRELQQPSIQKKEKCESSASVIGGAQKFEEMEWNGRVPVVKEERRDEKVALRARIDTTMRFSKDTSGCPGIAFSSHSSGPGNNGAVPSVDSDREDDGGSTAESLRYDGSGSDSSRSRFSREPQGYASGEDLVLPGLPRGGSVGSGSDTEMVTKQSVTGEKGAGSMETNNSEKTPKKRGQGGEMEGNSRGSDPWDCSRSPSPSNSCGDREGLEGGSPRDSLEGGGSKGVVRPRRNQLLAAVTSGKKRSRARGLGTPGLVTQNVVTGGRPSIEDAMAPLPITVPCVTLPGGLPEPCALASSVEVRNTSGPMTCEALFRKEYVDQYGVPYTTAGVTPSATPTATPPTSRPSSPSLPPSSPGSPTFNGIPIPPVPVLRHFLPSPLSLMASPNARPASPPPDPAMAVLSMPLPVLKIKPANVIPMELPSPLAKSIKKARPASFARVTASRSGLDAASRRLNQITQSPVGSPHTSPSRMYAPHLLRSSSAPLVYNSWQSPERSKMQGDATSTSVISCRTASPFSSPLHMVSGSGGQPGSLPAASVSAIASLAGPAAAKASLGGTPTSTLGGIGSSPSCTPSSTPDNTPLSTPQGMAMAAWAKSSPFARVLSECQTRPSSPVNDRASWAAEFRSLPSSPRSHGDMEPHRKCRLLELEDKDQSLAARLPLQDTESPTRPRFPSPSAENTHRFSASPPSTALLHAQTSQRLASRLSPNAGTTQGVNFGVSSPKNGTNEGLRRSSLSGGMESQMAMSSSLSNLQQTVPEQLAMLQQPDEMMERFHSFGASEQSGRLLPQCPQQLTSCTSTCPPNGAFDSLNADREAIEKEIQELIQLMGRSGNDAGALGRQLGDQSIQLSSSVYDQQMGGTYPVSGGTQNMSAHMQGGASNSQSCVDGVGSARQAILQEMREMILCGGGVVCNPQGRSPGNGLLMTGEMLETELLIQQAMNSQSPLSQPAMQSSSMLGPLIESLAQTQNLGRPDASQGRNVFMGGELMLVGQQGDVGLLQQQQQQGGLGMEQQQQQQQGVLGLQQQQQGGLGLQQQQEGVGLQQQLRVASSPAESQMLSANYQQLGNSTLCNMPTRFLSEQQLAAAIHDRSMLTQVECENLATEIRTRSHCREESLQSVVDGARDLQNISGYQPLSTSSQTMFNTSSQLPRQMPEEIQSQLATDGGGQILTWIGEPRVLREGHGLLSNCLGPRALADSATREDEMLACMNQNAYLQDRGRADHNQVSANVMPMDDGDDGLCLSDMMLNWPSLFDVDMVGQAL